MSNTAYRPVEYWDARAKDYAPGELGVLGENLTRWMIGRYMGGDRFLEVGSGNGRVYLYLRDKGIADLGNYLSCDISKELADECARRTGLCTEVWNGRTLPYIDDRIFDWVISANVLLHVPPDDLDQHVSELARVSRRYVFVSTYIGPGEGLASHCFSHDYEMAWQRAGLDVEAYAHFGKEQQGQWLLTV